MQYEDLNGHFRERIREKVARKLAASNPGRPVSDGIRDYVVGVIILIADKNHLPLAAYRLWEMKQANAATACSMESAAEAVTMIGDRFGTEVSILRDLYQMQDDQADITEILAHAEKRLLEP